MPASPHTVYRRAIHLFGKVGIAFVAFLALWQLVDTFAPSSPWGLVGALGAIACGVWLFVRLLRVVAGMLVWRLRDRLVITYLFIGLMPLLMLLGLFGVGGYILAGQLGAYLVTGELERRFDDLQLLAERALAMPDTAPAVDPNLPLVEFTRSPAGVGDLPRGTALRDGKLYFLVGARADGFEVRAAVPVTNEVLATFVPSLGSTWIQTPSGTFIGGGKPPESEGVFDLPVSWPSPMLVTDWQDPAKRIDGYYILLRTRISAIRAIFFGNRSESTERLALITLFVAFCVVELICYVIGIGMTRTITGAFHNLFEGTQKVMLGDLGHRIEVRGNDQLADLTQSFNRMTENVQELLEVSKEKERLQSEIEIAREVQTQLFPRATPQLRSLKITAVCHAARLVSGDYYDYAVAEGGDSDVGRVWLSIGDVAGKGISAALLMATLQSAMRAHLQDLGDAAAPAELMSRLNQQLYKTTSPEKYATLCMGYYNESDSTFRYCNAGHVPPAMIRAGRVERLAVNGTVVGAFSFARYEESELKLEPNDLLVFVTDGVTEPENAYGEMFGEERLFDLLAKNAHLDEAKIVEMLTEAIGQWTGSGDLQDDLTLLIARRVG